MSLWGACYTFPRRILHTEAKLRMDWRAVIHLTCTPLSSTHGQPSKCICNVYITHIQESSTFFAKGQTSATTRDMAGHRQVQRSRPTATRPALHLPYCPLNLVLKVVKKKEEKRRKKEGEEGEEEGGEEDVADSRWFVCSLSFWFWYPFRVGLRTFPGPRCSRPLVQLS